MRALPHLHGLQIAPVSAAAPLTPEQKRIVRAEIAKPRPAGDLPDVMELIVKMFKLTGR